VCSVWPDDVDSNVIEWFAVPGELRCYLPQVFYCFFSRFSEVSELLRFSDWANHVVVVHKFETEERHVG
jgi:hypothetical protein